MRWTIALRIAPAVGVCCSLWLGAGESRAVASPPVPVPEVAPVPPPPLADDDGAAGDPAVEKLAQAENFAARRDWNQAIAVLTEVIDSPAAPETLRNDARQRRADAYLTRRKAGDFALALADRRAVGEPGLYVQVAATNATLQRGRNTTGRLRRGEIILISAIKGDWYWVAEFSDPLPAAGARKSGYVSRFSVVPLPADYAGPESAAPGAPAPERPSYGAPNPRSFPSDIGAKRGSTSAQAPLTDSSSRRQSSASTGSGSTAQPLTGATPIQNPELLKRPDLQGDAQSPR